MKNYVYMNDKIVLYDEDHKLLAEVTFPEVAAGTVDVNHTFIDDSLRGQGVAGQLMDALAVQLRAQNKKAVLSCSYARAWFEKHPEHHDLVEQMQ